MTPSSYNISVGVALCVVSLTLGYHLGALSTSMTTSRKHGVSPGVGRDNKAGDSQNNDSSGDEDEDDESANDGNLASVTPGLFEQCKMVLVVRTDLNMTPGKIAAQCGHATLACYKALTAKNPQLVRHWEITGQAKIALKAKSDAELDSLTARARELGICVRSIRDAGHTQVDPGTRTVLGIGPAPVNLVNQVTGSLRLL